MKNNGEEEGKLLVMGVADENKKAAENKIYKLSGFVNKNRFIYFIFCRFRAVSYNRKCLFISDLHVFSS